MRTKKITKKEIAATLRSMNVTAIHRLCVLVTGTHHVYEFVKQYAPTNKVARQAYNIAYPRPHYWYGDAYKGKHGHFEPLPRQAARLFFENERKRGTDSYTKAAWMGHTWLYAASPVYGHRDYNKARMIPIEGNERYCEILVKKYGPETFR